MLRLGILGLHQSGKSTLLRALNEGRPPTRLGGRIPAVQAAVIKVPDHRLKELAQICPGRKLVHAEVEYLDFPYASLGQKDKSGEAAWVASLRTVDALVVVLRAFDRTDLLTRALTDHLRTAQGLELELILADLPLVERRLEKLVVEVGRATAGERAGLLQERATLIQLQDQLNDEAPLRSLALDDKAWRQLRGFQFLTAKPVLFVLNIAEQELDKTALAELEFARGITGPNTASLAISAQIEMELAVLDPPDRKMFMDDLELTELSAARVIQACHQVCRLRTFFTVGDEEVRAWCVPEGTLAPQAAGLVHSDMERGFIRAEVVPFDTLAKAGSMTAARRQGIFRQEGRTYTVNHGDVVHFLFSR